MLNSRAIFVFALFSMLPETTFVSAQTAAKPKLSASAIRIAMVETGDVPIPAEFRFAMYERLVEDINKSGAFPKVYRSGDRAADGVSDLVTLHTTVQAYKQGSQTVRGLTTVLGATRVDITTSVTGHDGSELTSKMLTARVRFFGENLGVTDGVAKQITKFVRESAGH